MTSPPPPVSRGRPGGHARTSSAGVTRIVQTDDLPPGVDALASADGKTIIVRASLDQVSRRRAMREVLTSIRRFPRLALYPALSAEAIRHLLRRVEGAVNSASQAIQQLLAAAGDHLSGLTVAVTAAAGTAAVVTVVAVTATPSPRAGSGGGPQGGTVPGGAHPVATATLPAVPLSYLGVYEDGVPASFGGILQFETSVGVQPNIALYYSSWNEQFNAGFAWQAYDNRVTPAVQIEPFGVSMAGIAAGSYDQYLESYATAVRDFGHAVIIGFAHEPNGPWYPWGAGSVSPATWIAAWRHVVDVFNADGARNVIWLWTVNAQGAESTMADAWWPGSSYVGWIGIDGYYTSPGDTFGRVFGAVLSEVQGLGKPIIISETAVGPRTGNQVAGVDNLFAGLRSSRLLGLIWFDKAQDNGQYKQDWRLEGNPALVTAFRAASGYISS
ncbi:MAG TPA: glycosyl hydrolase [Streptosporangiaceae bacterium]|nr:glycosyl hydrolase [Streptosporangiaceae bacterium]